MDIVSPGLALTDDHPTTDVRVDISAVAEWAVRAILIAGFLAILALEAYLIWEGLSLL
jgi:hypothetical protein